MKNSDLLSKFKSSLNCADQAEKKQNRDLFKRFVNTVAVVKEIEDVKYVVIRKKYQHLIQDDQNENNAEEEFADILSPVLERENSTRHSQDGKGETLSASGPEPPQTAISSISECASNDSETHSPTLVQSPIELALERVQYPDFKTKRYLNFGVDHTSGAKLEPVFPRKIEAMHNKPYALPLRMPPTATRIEIRKLKSDDDPPMTVNPGPDSPSRIRRRPSGESHGSPLPRRSTKSSKSQEEPKFPSTVPLEQAEHQWLVGSATGLWSQVYGLLMRDAQLAEKRDFMSGFTALHWAAKSGNSDMVAKLIDKSRDKGIDIDVNAKTHGGYTPLHIAAMHDQEYILALLVKSYGADVKVRDNCGKKAYHYLHGGISEGVRKLLGQPTMQHPQETAAEEQGELDLFPDLSKGLHTISRLFQPHVSGPKKRKQRPGFLSLGNDPREDTDDGVSRHRASDLFS